jgi:hypothetical protein
MKQGRDGGKYVIGNVVILCPNCHAAVHGLGEKNQPQVYVVDKPVFQKKTEPLPKVLLEDELPLYNVQEVCLHG